MSKIVGRLGALKISLDGGSSYQTVNGLVDGTLNGDQAEVKVTSHDDGQYETYLPGRKNWTVDAKCHYDEADAGQINVTSSFLANTTVLWQMYLQSGTGFKIATGSGFVTKLVDGSPNDDAASFDFTVRITGQLTWTNQ